MCSQCTWDKVPDAVSLSFIRQVFMKVFSFFFLLIDWMSWIPDSHPHLLQLLQTNVALVSMVWAVVIIEILLHRSPLREEWRKDLKV